MSIKDFFRKEQESTPKTISEALSTEYQVREEQKAKLQTNSYIETPATLSFRDDTLKIEDTEMLAASEPENNLHTIDEFEDTPAPPIKATLDTKSNFDIVKELCQSLYIPIEDYQIEIWLNSFSIEDIVSNIKYASKISETDPGELEYHIIKNSAGTQDNIKSVSLEEQMDINDQVALDLSDATTDINVFEEIIPTNEFENSDEQNNEAIFKDEKELMQEQYPITPPPHPQGAIAKISVKTRWQQLRALSENEFAQYLISTGAQCNANFCTYYPVCFYRITDKVSESTSCTTGIVEALNKIVEVCEDIH